MNYKNAYEEMKKLYELLQQENEKLKDRDLIIAAELTKLQDENKQLKQKYEMQKDSNKLLCKAITCDDCNCKVCEAHKDNIELKKRLEEWEHHLKCSKGMLDIQGQKGNYDYDEYMLGLYNGMECIIALFETREPNYISGKDAEFTNSKTQQKNTKV